MKRFEILRMDAGLLPYALLDTMHDEIILWADDIEGATIAKEEYNLMVTRAERLMEAKPFIDEAMHRLGIVEG